MQRCRNRTDHSVWDPSAPMYNRGLIGLQLRSYHGYITSRIHSTAENLDFRLQVRRYPCLRSPSRALFIFSSRSRDIGMSSFLNRASSVGYSEIDSSFHSLNWFSSPFLFDPIKLDRTCNTRFIVYWQTIVVYLDKQFRPQRILWTDTSSQLKFIQCLCLPQGYHRSNSDVHDILVPSPDERSTRLGLWASLDAPRVAGKLRGAPEWRCWSPRTTIVLWGFLRVTQYPCCQIRDPISRCVRRGECGSQRIFNAMWNWTWSWIWIWMRISKILNHVEISNDTSTDRWTSNSE
jgi:hypothetical protein